MSWSDFLIGPKRCRRLFARSQFALRRYSGLLLAAAYYPYGAKYPLMSKRNVVKSLA